MKLARRQLTKLMLLAFGVDSSTREREREREREKTPQQNHMIQCSDIMDLE